MKNVLVTLTLIGLVAACATSPLGRRQLILVSAGEMDEMGAASFTEMQKKVPATKDAKASAYVSCVATAVLNEMGGSKGWEVVTFDDKQVNAFALPGRKIGVYAGMLKVAQNADQLAAVLGHEVAHVRAGHSAERVSEQMATQMAGNVAVSASGIDPQILGMAANVFFLMPHSRTQESEADLLGLDYMARAGFDPRQAPELWRNMSRSGGGKPPEMLSTHPSDSTRIDNLTKRLTIALPLYEEARASGKKPACKAG